MKKICFAITIAVFLSICLNGLQAQITETKLYQVELLKQFVGNWKREIAKDTTGFWDVKSYGTGLEENEKYVTKGKIILEGKGIYGYDKRLNKFIVAGMHKGEDMEIYVLWFISINNYELVPYTDIYTPEKASFKLEGEFKSPDMIIETLITNNKPVKTNTWTRIK